jgi:hypothetical protein
MRRLRDADTADEHELRKQLKKIILRIELVVGSLDDPPVKESPQDQ